MIRLHLILLFVALSITASAHSYVRQGAVNDYAGVLTVSEKTEVSELCQNLRDLFAVEAVVVIVPSLHHEPLDTLCLSLGRSWSLGRNSFLIVVVQQDKIGRLCAGCNIISLLPEDRTWLQNAAVMFGSGAYIGGIEQTLICLRDMLKGSRAQQALGNPSAGLAPQRFGTLTAVSSDNHPLLAVLVVGGMFVVILGLSLWHFTQYKNQAH